MPHRETKKYFSGQRPYENAVLVLRRHWIVLLGILIAYTFFAVLPLIVYAFIEGFLSKSTALMDSFAFFAIAYYMIWWYGLFYQLTDYILDIWVVTDHRIIDTEQFGLFHRNIAETSLPNVQDASVDVQGVLETFFNFGNVHIQTAGPIKEIIFKQVPRPVHAKDVILHMFSEYLRTHPNRIEHHEISLE